jgi:hypothetical protein
MSHKLAYSSFETIHNDVTATQNTHHIDIGQIGTQTK